MQNAVERRQGVLDFLAGIDSKEMKDVTPFDGRDLKFGDFTIDGAATFYYDPVAGRLVDGGTGNAFEKDN